MWPARGGRLLAFRSPLLGLLVDTVNALLMLLSGAQSRPRFSEVRGIHLDMMYAMCQSAHWHLRVAPCGAGPRVRSADCVCRTDTGRRSCQYIGGDEDDAQEKQPVPRDIVFVRLVDARSFAGMGRHQSIQGRQLGRSRGQFFNLASYTFRVSLHLTPIARRWLQVTVSWLSSFRSLAQTRSECQSTRQPFPATGAPTRAP